MISRRTLLLSPLAAYLPLPAPAVNALNLTHWPFVLPAPDLTFGVAEGVSVSAARDILQIKVAGWGVIDFDEASRKLFLYLHNPSSPWKLRKQ